MRDLIDTGSAFGVFAAFAAAVAWDVPRVGEGAAIVAMVVALAVACAAVVQVYTGRAWWRPSREGRRDGVEPFAPTSHASCQSPRLARDGTEGVSLADRDGLPPRDDRSRVSSEPDHA